MHIPVISALGRLRQTDRSLSVLLSEDLSNIGRESLFPNES